MIVELTLKEVSTALYVAGRRNDIAIRKGNKARYNDGKKSAHTQSAEILMGHFMGCGGELAVCKALDVEWSKSINTYHKVPDVIYKDMPIEVKCSGENPEYSPSIQIRNNDYHLKDDSIVVAVERKLTDYDRKVYTMHLYEVLGWVYAGDVRQDQYFKVNQYDDGQDRWVYNDSFKPIEELINES